MEDNRFPLKARMYKANGKRNVCRPRKRWELRQAPMPKMWSGGDDDDKHLPLYL